MPDNDARFLGFVLPDGTLRLDLPKQYRAFVSRFKGCEMEIEIREKGRNKTRDQEKGFHAMIQPWARDEGHAINALKHDLLAEIFGYEEKLTPRGDKILKEPHTSSLTVRQYSELIERTLEIAAWSGYVLVAPDEYTRLKEKERKKAAKQPRKEERLAKAS